MGEELAFKEQTINSHKLEVSPMMKGMAADSDGSLYIPDVEHHKICKVTDTGFCSRYKILLRAIVKFQ